MEISVLNISGKETGRTVLLADEIYGIEPNNHAIYLDVKQYLANQRQGTHKSKERGEVSGTTKKLKKQKGTGGARAGSMKSPVFVGGGRVFGPRPRNYSFKLNKKLKALARQSALAHKAKSNNIVVVEPFTFEKPSTKQYISLLNGLSLSGKKTLLVLPEQDNTIYLSSRNIQKVKVVTVDQLNTYDLINADNLLLSEKSIDKLESLLSK